MEHDSPGRYFLICIVAFAGISAGISGNWINAFTWIVVLVWIAAEYAASLVIAAQREYIELLENKS